MAGADVGTDVHEPVMLEAVRAHLAPERGGLFVDCTVGPGGHAQMLLRAGATRVVGLDRDPSALALAAERLKEFGDRVELVHRDFREIEDVLDARGVRAVDGVLADLGVSSLQLDAAGRGFSFRRDEPLDMRMDQSSGPTAADAIAAADETTLADVIYAYGEERHSRRIARAIVRARQMAPIDRTGQLAEIVRRVMPRKGYARIDPATRTFQAIRIWVNRELEGLERFLVQAAGRLRTDGRLVIIAFHSLEDRIVKHTFRSLAADTAFHVRTKRPQQPDDEEIAGNPRARSARLRALERAR